MKIINALKRTLAEPHDVLIDETEQEKRDAAGRLAEDMADCYRGRNSPFNRFGGA